MPEGVLLVQAAGPPHPGGTNVVLRRLLDDAPGQRLDVVVDRALRRRVRARDPLALDASYRYVLKLPPLRPFAGLAHLLNVPLAVLAGVRAALVARRARSAWVLTSFDGGFSQIAAAVAARLVGRPLIVLVFDLWEENAYGRVERAIARLVERRIVRGAAAVVVFCEEAAAHYEAKHGTTAAVLRIPLEPGAEAPAVALPPAGREDVVDVLVGGAVYWAQEDAVRRLCQATRAMDGFRVTVVGDRRELQGRGIQADAYEPRLSGAEFRRRLAAADVLFLGLSLDSPHPDVIRTATPARLVEFMASGRPLLVHAPADSHVARYAAAEDFAEVVGDASVEALAAGLRRIADHPDLAAARSARARKLAAANHDPAAVGEHLRSVLERAAES